MEFQHEAERIYAQAPDGSLLAEVTFPTADGVANIDHTFVDPSLRGRNVAGQLLTAAVQQIRDSGLKVFPTCSYAVKWFASHPEHADLLK